MMVNETMVEAGCKAHFNWYASDATNEGQRDIARKQVRTILEAALSTDAEPVEWQWRSRIKGGVWDAWENGRYGQEVPPFMEVEERRITTPPAPSVAVKALQEAYRAGFNASSQGYNGEIFPEFESDNEWLGTRDGEIYELRSALSAQVHDVAEYERREQVCKDAALSQWERSLKRPDLTEKDRVIGAVEAYKRQAFAFTMLPAAPAAKKGEAE